MNASTYLQSYGWTPGTSLGNPLSAPLPTSSSSSTRLTKRILISAKNNTHGIGRKASNLNQSDLWWEKAFDVSLKKLDVTKDTPSRKDEVVDNMNLFAGLGGGNGRPNATAATTVRSSSLYKYFVRGEGLEGTIATIDTSFGTTEVVKEETQPTKKRKRDDTNTPTTLKESKSDKKAAKEERRRLRQERRAAKLELKRLRTEKRIMKEKERTKRTEKKTLKKQAKELASQERIQSDSGVDLSRDATPIPVLEVVTLLTSESKKEKKQKQLPSEKSDRKNEKRKSKSSS